MWKSSQVCLIGVVIGCLLVSVASQSGVLSGDDVLLLPTETTSDPFDQIQLSERYDWRTGRYSPCSVTCIGTQTRDVYCVETLRNGSEIRVDENLCDSYSVVVKPNSERTCGRECIEHAWNTTSWSNCSAVCGNGTQTRGVRCRRVTSGRNVADSECIRRGVGGKPPESRVCTRVCFYSTGRWRPCSVTCGGGKRTRGVRCIRKGTDRSMTIVRLSHCSADETLTMPKTSEDCNRNVCGEHKWMTGGYGECSSTCGGTKTREVVCAFVKKDRSFTVSDDEECDFVGAKPNGTTTCGQTVPANDGLYDLIRDSICPDTCCYGHCMARPTPCRFTYPGGGCGCPVTTYTGTCQQEVTHEDNHEDVTVRCTCQHPETGGRELLKEIDDSLPTGGPPLD